MIDLQKNQQSYKLIVNLILFVQLRLLFKNKTLLFYTNSIFQILYIQNTMISNHQHIKYIETKSVETFIVRRKQLLKNFGVFGPADANILFYCKQGTFLSKREQRTYFYFFQGLNVYPQNLSVFLRNFAHKEQKNSKQKLVKGVFIIYDMIGKYDAIIQINIPGALKIFKVGENKQLLSNEAIDRLYICSMLRTFYQKNLAWGRYFQPFSGDNPLLQFRQFLDVFCRNCNDVNEIYISDQYDNCAIIKGSHNCDLLLKFAKRRNIIHHIIDYFSQFIKKNSEKFWQNYKLAILYAECLSEANKFYKSLKIASLLGNRNFNDPFILYYQAKYLKKLGMHKESLKILKTIKQFNQFDIWILISEIYVYFKMFSDALLCLNYACKLIKNNPTQHIPKYKDFESLGKIKKVDIPDDIQLYPIYLIQVEQPVAFMIKQQKIDEKFKQMMQSNYWKLLPLQRIVYKILVDIRENVTKKEFSAVIENTFQKQFREYLKVDFKKGLSTGNIQHQQNLNISQEDIPYQENKKSELPNFLANKKQIEKPPINNLIIPNRNLSIIPQIQSFIQNSVFEQKKKGQIGTQNKYKQIQHDKFSKIIKFALNEDIVQSAQIRCNYNTILPLYNRLRKNVFSNYNYNKMFKIFSQTQNYRSVIILLAQYFNELQSSGVRKIQKVPYWVEKYLIEIINEKGLSHLNEILEKLKFYDEAIIDTIKRCHAWKIQGIQF